MISKLIMVNAKPIILEQFPSHGYNLKFVMILMLIQFNYLRINRQNAEDVEEESISMKVIENANIVLMVNTKIKTFIIKVPHLWQFHVKLVGKVLQL